MSAIPKYRPNFSREELEELHYILTNTPHTSIRDAKCFKAIVARIGMLKYKIDVGVTKSSYVQANQEAPSLISQLGGEDTTSLDPLVAKATIYTKYSTNPELCSEDDVIIAIEYKQLILKEELTIEEQALLNASWGM